MSNLLDIQSTAAYIKACAATADLNVSYDKAATHAHVSGKSIVIPEMNSVASVRDLRKLRSFVAGVVANKLYSGDALQQAGYSYEGKDAALANIYNAVEGQRVQRIASKQYAGDKQALTDGHKITVEDTIKALDGLDPEQVQKMSPLLAACAMAEMARSDFDAYGTLNAEELLRGAPEAAEILSKAEDAGLVDKVASVASSEESLDVARAIYELIEGNPPPPPENEGEASDSGEGEGDGSEEGSASGDADDGSEAAKALKAMMGEGTDGEPSGVTPDYVGDYSAFKPCQNFKVIDCYKGDSYCGGAEGIHKKEVSKALTKSRGLANIVRRLFQVKSHKFYRGGLKSGKLHGRNLARAAFPSETYSQRVFRKKQENDTLDTAVELLVDFSGSMSGSRLNTACAGAGLLSSTLTTLGMPNEIIGFTEPFGVANPPCIQYVIKPFGLRMSEPAVLESFGHASKTTNHNNDGDSLLWAYSRLMARPEKRKVLIVLSDGRPESGRHGAASNHASVVKEIEKQGLVDLVGIGIESHEVNNFYTTSFVVNDTSDLPNAILNTIKRKIL